MNRNISGQVTNALEAGQGILRLAPTWVPRSFGEPGGRLPLAEQDLYVLGSERGGLAERWLASTTQPDHGQDTPPDEGLSYVVGPDGELFLLRDAIEAAGSQIIGQQMMDKWGRWPVLGKFFDYMGRLPFHLHPRGEHAALVEEIPKPEAYYWPPQLNRIGSRFPLTYFGLEPGTTKEDIYHCLERWGRGGNGILELSKAYQLKPGTGWITPSGLLHAPGSLVHYEIQWGTDTLAMFESMVEGRVIPWDMLVKNVPEDRKHDLEFIVGLIDWEANIDPYLKQSRYLEPKPVCETGLEGFQDRWVIYGKADNGQDLFSARELTVEPGGKATIKDSGASGIVAIQGRGMLGINTIEAAHCVRYDELTWDEYFVTDEAVRAGFMIENTGHEPLVLLRHFGPGNQI
jgi:hypothetical protein